MAAVIRMKIEWERSSRLEKVLSTQIQYLANKLVLDGSTSELEHARSEASDSTRDPKAML